MTIHFDFVKRLEGVKVDQIEGFGRVLDIDCLKWFGHDDDYTIFFGS
jgi:hypothetical protein